MCLSLPPMRSCPFCHPQAAYPASYQGSNSKPRIWEPQMLFSSKTVCFWSILSKHCILQQKGVKKGNKSQKNSTWKLRIWPKKSLIHYYGYKVWTNHLKHSFKSLEELVKTVICLSTLSWGETANLFLKYYFNKNPSSFSIRLLNTNCELPEISKSWQW